MANTALERFMGKVFAEAGFRGRFLLNPEEAMTEFKMTREEKQALMRFHASFDLSDSGVVALAARVEPLTWWFG